MGIDEKYVPLVLQKLKKPMSLPSKQPHSILTGLGWQNYLLSDEGPGQPALDGPASSGHWTR